MVPGDPGEVVGDLEYVILESVLCGEGLTAGFELLEESGCNLA